MAERVLPVKMDSQMTRFQGMAIVLMMVVAVMLCGVIYYPGIHGPMLLDDVPVLSGILRLDAGQGGLENYAVSSSGLLKRPVSMVSFIFNALTSGNDLSRYKLTNIAIHLITGLTVFWLSALIGGNFRRQIPRSGWLFGGLVAAVWALHPLQVSTVLYTVQRMTELSALFSFAALLLYGLGRALQREGKRGMFHIVFAFAVFWPLAIFSKENGILVPLFAALMEFYFLKERADGKSTYSRNVTLALLLAPILMGIAYTAIRFDAVVLRGYEIRTFGLGQRLLTEPRVLVSYIHMLIAPRLGDMGFVHDDYELSTSVLQPWTTLPSILAIVGLVVVAIRIRNINPIAAFGIAMFLAGHVLESSVLPLEIMFEHRNYLPSWGFALAAVGLFQSLPIASIMRRGFAVAWIVLLTFVLFLRVDTWSSTNSLIAEMYRTHPNSERIKAAIARDMTDRGRYDQAREILTGLQSSGAAVHRLAIQCRSDGALTGKAITDVANQLTGLADVYLVMEIEDLANIGLDKKCVVPFDPFIELLDASMKLPAIPDGYRFSFLMYKAHYEREAGRLAEAVQALELAFRAGGGKPVPLFLASAWLAEARKVDEAKRYESRAADAARTMGGDYTAMANEVAHAIARSEQAGQ